MIHQPTIHKSGDHFDLKQHYLSWLITIKCKPILHNRLAVDAAVAGAAVGVDNYLLVVEVAVADTSVVGQL